MYRLLALFLLVSLVVVPQAYALPAPPQLETICWVAYSPTNYNPDQGIFPSQTSLQADFNVLYAAGFRGLVTYGADNVLGTSVPQVAQNAGLSAMIMGVWNPNSTVELANAVAAASSPILVGYVVGNEGLYESGGDRYTIQQLEDAMNYLRTQTNLPVTTSEQWGDYIAHPELLTIGDWVYPNVHPYWAGITEPTQAAIWTYERYKQFKALTDLPVNFKEVGLPSAGSASVSEANQDTYYRVLAETPTVFTYFEAFDQTWKNWAAVEPHWGVFKSDRSAKTVSAHLCPPMASVSASVALQGRPAPPDPRQVVALHVVVSEESTGLNIYYDDVTTDTNGQFVIDGFVPGNFAVRVKGSHTLARVIHPTFAAGSNALSVPTLLEGDADNSNAVTITDFAILAAAFGKTQAQAGYDGRADFNGDTAITILDFSLLAANFGQAGAP